MAIDDERLDLASPSVNSRLQVLGEHISGGKFDAFFSVFFVFWVFFCGGNLGFWGIPPGDSWK